MQYTMQVFEYEDNAEFRVMDRDGEPWFVLSEVCEKLDIGNPSAAASRLDDDEKGIITIDTLGGSQKKRVINESGLYSIILSSRKPEAKRLKNGLHLRYCRQSAKLAGTMVRFQHSSEGIMQTGIGWTQAIFL